MGHCSGRMTIWGSGQKIAGLNDITPVWCVPQYNIKNCLTHQCSCNVDLSGLNDTEIKKKRTPTKWTDDPLTTKTFIKKQHLDELRNALDLEMKLRNLTKENWDNPGSYFTAKQFQQIKVAIQRCEDYDKNVTPPLSAEICKTEVFVWDGEPYNPGNVITIKNLEYLRKFINKLQSVCACNCNYDCSCNCNYCTCYCNFCVCNCNYRCTCFCAYSDKRLKENIEYF